MRHTVLLILLALVGSMNALGANTWADNNIYLIGDFNDWKLPEGDDLNDARQLPFVEREDALGSICFLGIFDFPEGNSDFAMVNLTDSENPSYFTWGATISLSFGNAETQLCQFSGFPAYASDIADVTPMHLEDWAGGPLEICVNWDVPVLVVSLPSATDLAGINSISTDEAPDCEESYFNILGQRVDHPVPGQIYIRGGKKVIL